MYNSKTFNNILREHLNSHGISQKWLADQMNTTTATISRYVTGGRVPSLESLVDLSQALNVSVDYLLGIERPAPKSRTAPDIAVLTSCYEQAPVSIRKILWAALDPYMTAEQRVVVDASMAIEERDSNVG